MTYKSMSSMAILLPNTVLMGDVLEPDVLSKRSCGFGGSIIVSSKSAFHSSWKVFIITVEGRIILLTKRHDPKCFLLPSGVENTSFYRSYNWTKI